MHALIEKMLVLRTFLIEPARSDARVRKPRRARMRVGVFAWVDRWRSPAAEFFGRGVDS